MLRDAARERLTINASLVRIPFNLGVDTVTSALVERDCAATAAELLGWLLLAAASQLAATQSALLMGAVVCSSVHDTGSHEAGCTMHMASQQQCGTGP